jgi:hypothetical protein
MAKRDVPTPELLTTFRPESATPDDVEALIDLRIDQIDTEITKHQATVEELKAERKRWVMVSGGQSRITKNGGKEPEEVAP